MLKDGRFGAKSLVYPEHIDKSIFDHLLKFKSKTVKAHNNYEVWSDNTVHVVGTGALVTDPAVVDMELAFAKAAQQEDEAWGEGLADMRIGCALRIDFLVALTFVLDLWSWTTLEVVIFLVKSSTEEWRCRFADHPAVKPYTGKADALMSHSWGNNWGTLIAAAAQGAPFGRFVWICALANRQWAGNKADIDFKSMVERSKVVVVANPVPGGRLSAERMADPAKRNAFLASPEGKKAVSSLTTSRIWCIGAPIILSLCILLIYFLMWGIFCCSSCNRPC